MKKLSVKQQSIQNQEAIEKILDEVVHEVRFWNTEDGKYSIQDKGTTPDTILTAVVADILQIAHDHGFNYVHHLLYGALRFALWQGSNSPEYERLKPLFSLIGSHEQDSNPGK